MLLAGCRVDFGCNCGFAGFHDTAEGCLGSFEVCKSVILLEVFLPGEDFPNCNRVLAVFRERALSQKVSDLTSLDWCRFRGLVGERGDCNGILRSGYLEAH